VSSEARVYARVRALVLGMVEERQRQIKDVDVAGITLRRALRGGNVSLSTLAKIADALDYELVLNMRQKQGDR